MEAKNVTWKSCQNTNQLTKIVLTLYNEKERPGKKLIWNMQTRKYNEPLYLKKKPMQFETLNQELIRQTPERFLSCVLEVRPKEFTGKVIKDTWYVISTNPFSRTGTNNGR